MFNKALRLATASLLSVFVSITALTLTSQTSFAALAEFGAITTSEPGKVVFAVSDGSTFARYCLVELTVKDKTIHWISHPLEKDYVRREPSFVYNFDSDYLIISTAAQKNKDDSVAQLHLYHKPQQKLNLLAEASCEFPKDVKINKDRVEFDCMKAKKDDVAISKTKEGQIFQSLIKDKELEYSSTKIYEAKIEDWSFEIKETDDYFKDRLQIKNGETMLKEYKAKDFMRCFEYETLKGSQDKF